MGAAGDRRRPLRRTTALGIGLGVLVALTARGGADPTPPPPLPPLPDGRDDIDLRVEARHGGGAVLVELAVAVEPGGDALPVRSFDDAAVVAERLRRGQVVVHVGLAPPPVPEWADEVDTMVPPQPLPPRLVLPGEAVEASIRVDGSAAEVDGRVPAEGDDLRRLDEVRVCVWSRHEAVGRAGHPAACADDAL